jgi:hypothetical protein
VRYGFYQNNWCYCSRKSSTRLTVKDLIEHLSNTDKNLITDYFAFLEGRMVLVAPFNNEVTIAVIKSLEEIKSKTDKVSLNLKSEFAQHVFLTLIVTLSKQLMELHRYNGKSNDVLFYKTLQIVRSKFASGLALLCNAYKIDLSAKQTELAQMVLNHAYQPK